MISCIIQQSAGYYKKKNKKMPQKEGQTLRYQEGLS